MDMETVSLLAKYNAHANRGMGRAISALAPGEWDREFTGYFKSVHSLCSHLFSGDVLWLRRFLGIKAFSFAKDEILSRESPFGQDPFASVEDYHAKRLLLDDIFLSLAGELRPADLSATLSFTNLRGESYSRKVGGLVLHCFNHQTHHRAMISLYLEFLGKANDFSNLYPLA